MEMWQQAVTLTLLLLLKGYRGRGCSDSGDHVVRLSGRSVLLRLPNTQMNPQTVIWKMTLPPCNHTKVILRLRNPHSVIPSSFLHLNSTLEFKNKNWNLLITAAKPEYSGLYSLEITHENGTVFCIQFNILIVDHVEKPHLHIERKAMDEGKCQAVLSCLVSRKGSVSYAWYRDSKLIPTSGNLSQLVVQINANERNTYTCNVSNPASWETESLQLSQGCLEPRVWPLWVVTMIVVTLLLVALTCFCVWKRKRKQPQSGPSEPLTVYEDIKEVRKNQYSVSTSQPSQGTDLTLYSVIQGSQKTRCKKRNQDPSPTCTIYDQVGSRPLRAYNPARLSRRELENFEVHC